MWDLAWALHSFIGLWPDSTLTHGDTVGRIAASVMVQKSTSPIAHTCSMSWSNEPDIMPTCSDRKLKVAIGVSNNWLPTAMPTYGRKDRTA
jgi:hypothetical protein